ncbi:MAG: AAA family ATPase, partial [Deltaproteobacteria bacterium]|nr:AAA family ATPase [Deltaproteobacteria bacterium]
MQRLALAHLKHWKTRKTRKPLIIRGARQVGKSTLVQLFGSAYFEQLIVLNFERDPDLAQLFASNDPRKIVTLLELPRWYELRSRSHRHSSASEPRLQQQCHQHCRNGRVEKHLWRR